MNEGFAVGEAVLHAPNISIRQIFTDDIDAEHERLRDAMTAMHTALMNCCLHPAYTALANIRTCWTPIGDLPRIAAGCAESAKASIAD